MKTRTPQHELKTIFESRYRGVEILYNDLDGIVPKGEERATNSFPLGHDTV